MATLVCFHAHPDDESIATAGVMAAAAAAGHRVVLVVATRGEHGEPVPGVLADGEQLGVRRIAETFAAAEVLGVHRVEFLGYVDSGMMGEPTNHEPYSFWSADVGAAAERLAGILRQERADLLTVYDDNGGYGHPDHIQVHRVGVAAAALAGVTEVFESTINRTHIQRLMEAARQLDPSGEAPRDLDEEPDFGVDESRITHAIDVGPHLGAKRAAMRAHASQIPEEHFFLQMDDGAFAAAMGTEWFIRHGATRAPGSPFATDLWSGIG